MNTPGNTKKTPSYLAWLGLALLCACVGSGCKLIDRLKNRDSGGGGGGTSDTGGTPKYDPLFGRNIPKQDVPIPGRDGYADGKDPLLKNGNAKRTDDAEPYRPGPGTTPAALAAKPRDDAGIPIIDDRTPGTATGRGPVPFKPSASAELDTNGDSVLQELRKLGATWQPPRRGRNNETIFTCDVPLGSNGEGPIRRYEGVGPTDAAAMKDALNQIRVELAK
jgi:hypothetical protein